MSSAAGHTAVDSRSGVVNQPSESTSTSSVQSSAVVPSTNGDDMVQPQEAAMESSARNTFTPLTSSNFNPSNPPVDRDTQGNSPCPVTAQPTSSQRANAATSELASGRPDASGCLHQTASAPHTSSQGMQPSSATFGNHSHSSSDRSIPEGLISSKNPEDHNGKPVSPNETSRISPLTSTVQIDARTPAQQQQQRQQEQQQRQQWYDERQGGRMGGFSNLSSRPQQVTGQDDAGCVPAPGYAATQNLANYQDTGAGNQVEGIYFHSYTPT